VFVLALSWTLLRRSLLLLPRSAAVFAVLVFVEEYCGGGVFSGASCDNEEGWIKLFMLFIADATSNCGAEILRDIIDAVSICIETSLTSDAGAGIAAAADIARGGGII